MHVAPIRIVVSLSIGLYVLCALTAAAQTGAPQAGSLPLADVLAVAKPYPNLTQEVRLELVRAGARKEAIVCSGRRFDADWPGLAGARSAPYDCRIGRRMLTVSARQTFYDANGHRLGSDDPLLRKRAVRVTETGLQWRWR